MGEFIMNFEDTSEYIGSLCVKMFKSIKDEINEYAPKTTSFKESKEFFFSRSTTSTEVVVNQLYESLLNNVIERSINFLEDHPVTIKNAFYEYNFRNIMDEWRQGESGALSLLTGEDICSKDPRIVITTFATGSVLAIWLVILILIKSKSLSFLALKTVLALVSIVATYTVTRNVSLNKMHDSLRKDIFKVLDKNEKISNVWLNRALEYFVTQFDGFCVLNSIDNPR
jgi:hypothetical protein